MLMVGLTGGFASGKSFIGRVLESKGCHLIRADDLGHQSLAPDGEAYQGAIRAFGSAILREDGTVDRKALAGIVFADPDKLAQLNALVHPAVFRREQELLAAFETSDPDGIAVVEAAIMIEVGSFRRYQKLIVAVCSEEQQVERAMARDGIGREQALARIRHQMPLAEKASLADYVIDTSGTLEETRRRTLEVFEHLRSDAQDLGRTKTGKELR